MVPQLDAELAIEVRGLVKRYRGGRGQDDIQAVRGIDLAVRRGEVFGFLGPNGAGKTTTVRMLCTLLPISDGHATVAGVNVRSDPAAVRRHIGVALQEVGLDPTQIGRELLELQCALYRVRDPARRINAAGTTIFLTTQYLEEADQLCGAAGDHRRRPTGRRRHPQLLEGSARQRRDHGRPAA